MQPKMLLIVFTSYSLILFDSSKGSLVDPNEKCYFVNPENKETWKLKWQDNFQSEDYFEQNWNNNGGCDEWNHQVSCDAKDNAKLQDGYLVMRAKQEKHYQKSFTGAKLTTKSKFTYGRFEARTALSVDNDIWSGFYSAADAKMSESGRLYIHLFETKYGIHYKALFQNNTYILKTQSLDIIYSSFHLYGMEWSETEIKFFIDNYYSEPILLNETQKINSEQRLRLWIGVRDLFGPLPDKQNWKCPLTIVDYVRVYEKVSNPNVGLKLELCEEQNDVDQSSKKQRELVNSFCTIQTFPETLFPNKNKIDTSNGHSWEPCGGSWEQYKDEKCFQILDESTYSFESAIGKCASLEDMSTLAIIDSDEEQNFVSNFLFTTNKKVDNFWIGAKYSNNLFRWLDNSKLTFTNWHSNYPSKMGLNNSCVQMLSEEGLTGKWQNEHCETRNAVVCQKMQLWPIEQLQKSFLDARREIRELKNEITSLKKNQS